MFKVKSLSLAVAALLSCVTISQAADTPAPAPKTPQCVFPDRLTLTQGSAGFYFRMAFDPNFKSSVSAQAYEAMSAQAQKEITDQCHVPVAK